MGKDGAPICRSGPIVSPEAIRGAVIVRSQGPIGDGAVHYGRSEADAQEADKPLPAGSGHQASAEGRKRQGSRPMRKKASGTSLSAEPIRRQTKIRPPDDNPSGTAPAALKLLRQRAAWQPVFFFLRDSGSGSSLAIAAYRARPRGGRLGQQRPYGSHRDTAALGSHMGRARTSCLASGYSLWESSVTILASLKPDRYPGLAKLSLQTANRESSEGRQGAMSEHRDFISTRTRLIQTHRV